MYGRWEGELWFHRRHMWSVPSPSTPSLVPPINSSVFIDSDCFSKEGRKIHVGDCALFEPPNDSPPFVGIIRRLIVDKDDNLTLTVNWLYRPSDVKLLKGASPEAAPNEIFFSFHQDEIPAASLLHPCKVAFLRKGVELPSRVSSFVCRRVYDVETKRLWWLTDQDYINERQEVVNKLLDKTQVEMYGGQSGPNGTTELKGKKTDSDMLKAEIAKITDKGGLVDLEGVEKIIQLMQPESTDKKVDLASRIMIMNVISVTDRFDLLGKFVQLRGLLILDEWLQEFHKGSLKESDVSVEEFLFALLGALDRLPVNIHALQTCNVGKSVNHLRSHKNPEILKKARSLVDMWKKRVEDEMNMIERKRVEQMNIIETRSGTRRGGPNKSMSPEVSPHMVKQVKISSSQPSVVKLKHNSNEAIVKSPESSSPTKALATVPVGTGTPDAPPVTVKEEKSSSSFEDHGKGDTRLDNNVVGMEMGKGGVVGSDDDEACKVADSALRSNGTLKLEKSYEASYSSINALVESCAKFSEANESAPAGDDVGMNLLASVAAGEISRSDVSPSHSPENKQTLPEVACSEDNTSSRQSICESENNLNVRNNGDARLAGNGNAEVGPAPLVSDAGTSETVETRVKDESPPAMSSSDKVVEERKPLQKVDDMDSELLTSSSGHVILEQKAEQSEDKTNTDPDSSILQGSENVDKTEAQERDDAGPPDSTSETAVKLDFDLNEVLPSDDTEKPVSITVASAAEGPFLSSENLVKGEPEIEWKGPAATSAFRPAEPRKAREFLDFDLNADVVDDVSQNNPPSKRGGLDLDLNACEESPDVGPQIPSKSLLSGGFDLNNGPGVEDLIPHSRNGIQFLPNVPGVRTGTTDTGNFHPWSTYPAIPMGPGAPSQRMLNPEIFRGPVLSSSPAVAFQFPGFPFETNFSIPSISNTAYVGPSGGPGLYFPAMAGPLSSTYRPYVMSVPSGSSNVGPDNRKWGSHGLDLNSGHDVTLPSGLRQLPLGDQQLKMFQQMAANGGGGGGGGVLKRKEPVDGWDGDRISYKHPSWQ